MPRFFFHIRSAEPCDLHDRVGEVLPDDDAAMAQAARAVRKMTACAALDWRHCSYEIYDADDRHVGTVWFQPDAVSAAFFG